MTRTHDGVGDYCPKGLPFGILGFVLTLSANFYGVVGCQSKPTDCWQDITWSDDTPVAMRQFAVTSITKEGIWLEGDGLDGRSGNNHVVGAGVIRSANAMLTVRAKRANLRVPFQLLVTGTVFPSQYGHATMVVVVGGQVFEIHVPETGPHRREFHFTSFGSVLLLGGIGTPTRVFVSAIHFVDAEHTGIKTFQIGTIQIRRWPGCKTSDASSMQLHVSTPCRPVQ